MSQTIVLPRADGTCRPYTAGRCAPLSLPTRRIRSRVAYAAAHVVCDPLADCDPLSDSRLDWEATLAYRRYLWSLGLAVAEAMDTAQRGMGLGWEVAKELIRRSVAEARACGGRIACGAGTDHLEITPRTRLPDVAAAYAEQCAFVEAQGAPVILMASRALAACAQGPDDYRRVYGDVLAHVREPVIIHWLGEEFDPALAGYWGYRDRDAAMDVCLAIIAEHAGKVDGTAGSAVAGLRECKTQPRVNTPRAVWNPDLPNLLRFRDGWLDVPTWESPDNAFKAQWELFLKHVVCNEPFPWSLLEGAKGVQLAELGLRSWRERRWLDVPDLSI